jgi:hypothetical protein
MFHITAIDQSENLKDLWNLNLMKIFYSISIKILCSLSNNREVFLKMDNQLESVSQHQTDEEI